MELPNYSSFIVDMVLCNANFICLGLGATLRVGPGLTLYSAFRDHRMPGIKSGLAMFKASAVYYLQYYQSTYSPFCPIIPFLIYSVISKVKYYYCSFRYTGFGGRGSGHKNPALQTCKVGTDLLSYICGPQISFFILIT